MFARLETWFNAFFLGYAARVSGDLAVALVPLALLLVTIYVAVYGLAVMRGEAPEPVGTFAWKMVKVMAILSFALPGLYYSGYVSSAASRRPKQSRHNCETKVVTPPLMTTAGQPKPSNGAGFQGLRSKGVTSQSMPTQRSKVVSAFLMG